MSEKAKCVQITDLDRRKICEIQKKNPAYSQDQITHAASKELKKPGLKLAVLKQWNPEGVSQVAES